jgi:plastocyanin
MVSSAWNRLFRLVLFLSVALLAVQLAAPPLAARSSTNWQVNIVGSTFNPFFLTINVGDSVTWINNDGTVHSTVSNPGQGDSWNSGGIGDGTNYTHVFNVIGRFNYFCDVHPEMTGTVVVQQPVPEFPGSIAFLVLAAAVAAALLVERGLARRT